MKAAIVLFAILSMTVFPQNYGFLYSVADDANSVLVPEAEGMWATEILTKDTLVIEKDGDNSYHLYALVRKDFHFTGRFLKNENDLYLEIQPRGQKDYYYPFNTLLQISIEDDLLYARNLNMPWIEKQISENKLPFSYLSQNEKFIITSPPDDLKEILREHSVSLFMDGLILPRVKIE